MKKRYNITTLNHMQLTILLIVSKIPYLIAYYPGFMIWDTASSIAQFYGFKTHVVSISPMPDAILSNHHMILFTYLMGGFVKLGELIGSQNFGYFLYVIIQVVITNLIIAYGLNLIKQKISNHIYLIILLVYIFLPVISIWQITVSKDSLFTVFLLLLCILLYQICESNTTILKQRKFLVLFVFDCIMCVLTKQQGSYILLICAIVLLVVYRKKIIKIVMPMMVISVFYLTLFCNTILPALNVAPSSKQELMGFMFQQTARYTVDYPDDVTEEEERIISQVLPYDRLQELYDPYSQDPVKFEYNQMATDNDRNAYKTLWFKMFFKHPDSYIKATLQNCSGFFVPNQPNDYTYWPVYFEYSNILKEHDIFNLYNIKPYPIYIILTNVIEIIGSIPYIKIFFKVYFYVWATLVALILILIRKKYYSYIFMMPIILSLCLLVITPMFEFRYGLPFIYITPMLYGFLFIQNKNLK